MQPLESEFYEPSPLLRELQVLTILANDPESSQKDIALQVGLAPSMIHNYIHALADQGFVQFQGPTRRQLRYIVTNSGFTRIEALAGRHLAEAGRFIEKITNRLHHAIEKLASEGVRSLGVVARPALAGAVIRAASDTGLAVTTLDGTAPHKDSSAGAEDFSGFDAVLVAEDQTKDDVSTIVRRCREQGIRIYTIS